MPFLNIEPASGTGNTPVQISAEEYTGRSNKQASVRFQATSGDQPYVDVAVTQLGLGEQIQLDSESANIGDEGGTVTISGKSNLSTMVVSGFSGLNLTGAVYSINGGGEQTLTPGSTMSITPAGDPGAENLYTFSIRLTIGVNSSPSQVESEVTLSNGSSVSKTFTITQGMAAIFSVEPSSISFGESGGDREISITSNEDWICTSYLPSWLSLSEESGNSSASITVHATSNSDRDSRSFTLEFESDSGLNDSVTVSQAAASASLSVSPDTLSFSATGEARQITINANESWSIEGKPSWLTLSVESGSGYQTVNVTASASTSEEERSATLTVRTSSGLTDTVECSQAAAGRTYSDVEVTLSYPAGDIPASGGTKEPSVEYRQTWGYNGSTTGGGVITTGGSITWKNGGSSVPSGVVSGDNLGTTEKARTLIGDVEVTVSLNGKSGSDIAQVYQQVNAKEDITYGNWEVSISASNYTSASSPCPASGGDSMITASASRSRLQNYTSGAQETLSAETDTPELEASGTGLSISGTTATWANRGTDEGVARQGTITASHSDATDKSVTLYQQENERERIYDSDIELSPSSQNHNFEVEGGQWSPSFTTTQGYTDSYTSGASEEGSDDSAANMGTYSFSAGESVSWLSVDGRNITCSENSGGERSATYTVSVSAHGGKSNEVTVSITQDSANYLNVSPQTLFFAASGETKAITIDTNESWTIE